MEAGGVGVAVGSAGVGNGVTVGTRVASTKTVRGMGAGSSVAGVQARADRVSVIKATRTKLSESVRRR